MADGNAFDGNAREDLQDSGLRDGGLAARLLRAGIVSLDEAQRCAFASPEACRLLGAADESALRADWASIHRQLGLGDLSRRAAGEPPLCRGVDLHTVNGTQALRFEIHPIPAREGVRHVILVRERRHLGRHDRPLLIVAEAHANRRVLAGLVHEAKGPLNNFSLTLALLASTLARIESPAMPEAIRARWNRYLEILQNETARLTDCLHEIHGLTQPGPAADERIDVTAALREVARVLRHDAALREVTLELDLPATPQWLLADQRQLRLALLGFTSLMLEITQPGGSVACRVVLPEEQAHLLLRIEAANAALPRALIAEFFRVSGTAESDHAAAIAARAIIEAQGGDVTLEGESTSHACIVVRLRRADAPI